MSALRESIYFLVSNPPHSPSDDMNAIACALSTTVAEAGLMIRFPSSVIWKQAKRPHALEETQTSLGALGIRSDIIAADDIFSLPKPLDVKAIEIDSETLRCSIGSNNPISFTLDSSLVCVQQQSKAFGSEYRKFKEKERAKRDRKKQQALNDNLAVLAAAPKEILPGAGADGKQSMLITLSQKQKDSDEVTRALIRPASISYSFLGDKMATSLLENVTVFLQILSSAGTVVKTGLVDIPVRYPMLLNPSFIQQLEKHGLSKESFPPEMLMERLATLTAMLDRERSIPKE